jgi:hypothetical protein
MMGESHTSLEPEEYPNPPLYEIPVCDLVNELAKREGVTEITIGCDETYCVGRDDDGADIPPTGLNPGPARILVVID